MKKTIIGQVTSVKMAKTVVVAVEKKVRHPLYKKIISKIKKYKADSNNLIIKEGDWVEISPIRPLSKEKSFKVSKLVKK